jgi:hypothetical protein
MAMGLSKDIDTNGKILVIVGDTRGAFSDRSGRVLLDRFKRELEAVEWLCDEGPCNLP